jgi:flotillin
MSKPKRWGRVAAKPSEYLIKIRKGKVIKHGPGLSVFLWPGDTCTILPTSIQRTAFTADQITAEKVGVAVTGIAVYRVADPLLAFRMLDFSEARTSLDQLSDILRDMFIGAARRLVANMTVEQCLTQRKEAIAQELMREIQPVVSGQGRSDDATDQGWGIVIDTIEIQDVRILSEQVFANLQAPYRNHIELEARRAQLLRDEEVHLREVEQQRAMLEVDRSLAQRRSEAVEQTKIEELARTEHVRLAELESHARVANTQLHRELEAQERAKQLAEGQHTVARQKAELDAGLAERQAALDGELERQRAAREAELLRQRAEARLALEQTEVEAAATIEERRREIERLRGEQNLALQRISREIENLLPEERLRYDFALQTLPEVAKAFAGSFGPVHLTQIGSDGKNGVGFIAELLAQILAVGKSAGLDLSALGKKGTDPTPSNKD